MDLIRETSAADSTPHSEHPHPSPLEGPLVPPVLDLLEDVAASPLVLFVAFDLLHLFIQMEMSSIEEQQHTLNFKKLKKEEKKTLHLSSVKLFIPLVDHRIALGIEGVLDSVFANSRDVPVPAEDWSTDEALKRLRFHR